MQEPPLGRPGTRPNETGRGWYPSGQRPAYTIREYLEPTSSSSLVHLVMLSELRACSTSTEGLSDFGASCLSTIICFSLISAGGVTVDLE